jgi:hypothetical protein
MKENRLKEVWMRAAMLEASFYVLYQAVRSIWRPFAPMPVEIYFPN